MRKCINCSWKGTETVKPLDHCPVCGDNTEIVSEACEPCKVPVKDKVEPKLDLNNDGKIDKEDASIASKVMNKVKYSRKRKK